MGNLPVQLIREKMDSSLGPRNVCVVGAGTMGSGIAAHLANLDFSVTLLDVSQAAVQESFERARTLRPPLFYTPETAQDVRLGNIEDHGRFIEDADWIIEAIVERPDAKRALFEKLEHLANPAAVITTNTSGIELARLAEGRSESFRRRFLGTHFFNPPRYLKLLELIPMPDTDPELVRGMQSFLESQVARRVVVAKDTPGFIANRYGMWAMFHAIHVAEKLHLSIEEVDAITGPFLGRPKSGSFRLNDVVGLDVMRDIAANLQERCPHDPKIDTLNMPTSMLHLLARGWIGGKAGQGYYRKEGGELLALDLGTFAYRQIRDVDFPSLKQLMPLPLGERIAKALELRDPVGEFLRLYLPPVLYYAEQIQAEVSHSIDDFDRVMEWGFAWELGPFRMMDALRPHTEHKFYRPGEQRTAAGGYVPLPKEPQYAKITDFPVIQEGTNLRVRDLGDGIASVALTTKMGILSTSVVEEFITLLEGHDLTRFVFTSEAKSFSAGFDLKMFLAATHEERWDDIDHALLRLQHLGDLLEKRQVVAAIYGHCLGGGLELALSCAQIIAHPECHIGLPEARVGLIPAGRGTAIMRVNNQNSAKRLSEIAAILAAGIVAPTPENARTLGYLRPSDITCFHPDRLLHDAKLAALKVETRPRPIWAAIVGPLPGMIDREFESGVSRGDLTQYDHTIGLKLKQIFARSVNFADALHRERAEFIDLLHNALSVARLKNMVEHNKPLRN